MHFIQLRRSAHFAELMSHFSNSRLFLLGTSHQVANLNERESIGLPNDSVEHFYQGLEKIKGLKETIVLNTCNRTEIYGAADDGFEIGSLMDFLAKFRNLDLEFIRKKPIDEPALQSCVTCSRWHQE